MSEDDHQVDAIIFTEMYVTDLGIEEEDVMLANAGTTGLQKIQLQFLQHGNDIHETVSASPSADFDGHLIVHDAHIHLRPFLWSSL